jgi:hypothetical protein
MDDVPRIRSVKQRRIRFLEQERKNIETLIPLAAGLEEENNGEGFQ